MSKHAKKSNENFVNTTRHVLFQLAAATTDYFLLWPRAEASTAKKVMNATCAVGLHGLAYLAANYFEKPKAPSDNTDVGTQNSNSGATATTTAPQDTTAEAQPSQANYKAT
jgi:hypothetical protein